MSSDPSADAAATAKPSRKLYGTLFDEEEQTDGESGKTQPASARPAKRGKHDRSERTADR